MVDGLLMSDLGVYLTTEIAQRGLSIRRAAEKIGMSYGTLYGVLKGNGVPELPTLRKISEGLGISFRRLQELAGFSPDEDEPSGDPLYGITDEQRALLSRLSPEKKRALLDLASRLLE